MQWIKRSYLMLILVCAPMTALAHDLIQIYSDALMHDPTLLAAKQRLKAQGELIPQAYAVLLPNSSLSGEATKSRVKGTSFSGTQDRHDHSLSLSLTQSLFNLRSWFNVGVAKNSVKQAQAEYLAVAQNLIARTASAYFAVLQAQDTLRFTQAEVKAFSQELDQARERHKVGIDPITNVYDAQARYDSARAREIEAKNNIQNRFEDLRAITGIRYDHLDKTLKELPLIKPKPDNIHVWQASADENNFTTKANEFAAMVAKGNIKVAHADHYPTLNLFAEYNDLYTSRAGPGTLKSDNQEYSLGARLNWNLLEGGAVVSRTKQARFNWFAALQDLEAARRDAANQVTQTYNNVSSLISQIKANRQAIVSNQSSVKSNQEAFKVGTRTILDVLDAQQELTRAQQAHASSQYTYLNNRLALKQAAGILTVADLEEINGWLISTKPKQKNRMPAHHHDPRQHEYYK